MGITSHVRLPEAVGCLGDVNAMRDIGLFFRRFIAGLWTPTGALVCAMLVACTPSSPPAPLVIHEDAAQALAVAQAAHKPVILFYQAPWCASCRALKKTFEDNQVRGALQSLRATVIAVTLDADGAAATDTPAWISPQAMDIRAVPVLLFIDEHQHAYPAQALTGFVGPSRMVQWLKGNATWHF